MLTACILLTALAWLFLLPFSDRPWNRPCFCAAGDDSDVKVFPSSGFGAPSGDVSEREAQEYVENRQNGNIDIAREMGRQLAGLVIGYRPEEEPFLGDEQLLFQSRVLYLFAARTACDIYSPSPIVASTASQSLSDTISRQAAEVYNAFITSRTVTLYFLALDADDVGQAVGKAFASVCDHPEDVFYVHLGSGLYETFLSRCRAICTSMTYCR